MAHLKRTPLDVCVGYVIAVEAVREQTRIMRNNRCEEFSKGEIGMSGYREGAQDDCLSQYWSIVHDQQGREHPEREHDDMCDACIRRLQAFKDRREAKKLFGAAKRSVEAIGKRFIKEAK